jgi:hypothetical protein
MINRELEHQIKKTKDFIQLWMKFRELYQGALGRTNILIAEEKAFLDLKSTLVRQYQGLVELLNLSASSDDRTFEVISAILSLASVSGLTEMQLKKVESDWHSSYLNLNKILGSLENKKEQLAKINTAKITIDKFLSSRLVSLISVILFIILGYVILVRIFHLDEFIKQNLSFFKAAKTQSSAKFLRGGEY